MKKRLNILYLNLSLSLNLILVLILSTCSLSAQQSHGNFSFALVTDTHIGGAGAEEDLRRTVEDINASDSLAFVIISGDVTEFGSDGELLLAKEILDRLNKPWYIIPGNHDTKWSESGANSFRRIFGTEAFAFTHGGYLLLGTNSGPNMRMGPGQVPREDIVWLDSVLSVPRNTEMKIISINHYPLDNGLNNWYEITDRLKRVDTRLALCGHGHSNSVMEFEGIPALMGRSNLRARDTVGGYNIIRIQGDTLLTASERKPYFRTLPAWASVKMTYHDFTSDTVKYPRPEFFVNDKYPSVRELWRVQEKSDIGAGTAAAGKLVITTNTDGFVKALKIRNGKTKWQASLGAKIYSTPVITGSIAVAAVTDGRIYAMDLRSGRIVWSFDTGQPVVASPVISGGKVFIAGSWGKCHALNLNDGTIVWKNDSIDGFAETIPAVYKGMIIFGTWNNHLYALDAETGAVRWDWKNGYSNRMLSPAACVPVAVNDRVFVVAPDRKMACLDAKTGKVLWHSNLGGQTVRESMGVSEDSTLIFAKTMDGKLVGVPVSSSEGRVEWRAEADAGYDITPSVITEKDGVVLMPTDKGFIYAVRRDDGQLLWIHRISSCLVNHILPVDSHSLICTAMDGVVVKLGY